MIWWACMREERQLSDEDLTPSACMCSVLVSGEAKHSNSSCYSSYPNSVAIV